MMLGGMVSSTCFYKKNGTCRKVLLIFNVCGTLPGPEVIKHYSCSTQLRKKFEQLIKTKILKNKEVSCFKSLRCCIYHAYKC